MEAQVVGVALVRPAASGAHRGNTNPCGRIRPGRVSGDSSRSDGGLGVSAAPHGGGAASGAVEGWINT